MDLFNLTGKTALITGASSGLGERFAKCLSKAGARVILAARRADKLEALAKELGNARALPMDVNDENAVKHAFETIKDENIDICVNNAGIGRQTPVFEDTPTKDFEDTMQTNVMGLWYTTKAAANHMKDKKIAGSIINIGSIRGLHIYADGLSAYGASKAAVLHLTQGLANELAAHNIRINCIAPGLFHTPLTSGRLDTTEGKQKMADQIPLGFVADPEDMDGTLLYLASNKASRYTTGACLTVDGGAACRNNLVSSKYGD